MESYFRIFVIILLTCNAGWFLFLLYTTFVQIKWGKMGFWSYGLWKWGRDEFIRNRNMNIPYYQKRCRWWTYGWY